MSKHANQTKGLASLTRSEISPFERTLTREKSGHSRFNYELRTTAGAVLQGCDKLDSLLRHLDEKVACVVVRTSDGVTVAKSPGLDS